MPSIKTTVYLDEADYRAVQKLATSGGVSSAELIRQAIHDFVGSRAAMGAVRNVAESSPRYRVTAAPPSSAGAPFASAPLPSSATRLAEIQAIVREQPLLDPRSADEILGYDEWGLPT
jgi:hypothetical protein